MPHHEPCEHSEKFIGNTEEPEAIVEWFRSRGVIVRVGELAYDINGQPLPLPCKPLFTAQIDKHHSVMMEKTFGHNWRQSYR